MATNPNFDKAVAAVKAVATIGGRVKVSAPVHRAAMIAAAAAVAGAAFVSDNAILLGFSPTTVAYVSSAVAAVTTVLRAASDE